MESHEAILVRGGGVRSGSELPSWVAARLDHTVARHCSGCRLSSCAGAIQKLPPINADGLPILIL